MKQSEKQRKLERLKGSLRGVSADPDGPRELWACIEEGRAKHGFDRSAVARHVAEQFRHRPVEERVAAVRTFYAAMGEAYDGRLVAIYLFVGGGGDDGFSDWRTGLVLLGQEAFRRALLDPDSLADVYAKIDCLECEDGQYALGGLAEVPECRRDLDHLTGPAWTQADVRANCPRLVALFQPDLPYEDFEALCAADELAVFVADLRRILAVRKKHQLGDVGTIEFKLWRAEARMVAVFSGSDLLREALVAGVLPPAPGRSPVWSALVEVLGRAADKTGVCIPGVGRFSVSVHRGFTGMDPKTGEQG